MHICFKCSLPILNEPPIHGLHESCFYEWFKTSNSNFSNVALKKAFDIPKESSDSVNTSFFHGKFKKYAANLENRSYILKVQDDDYPELPRVEYLSNQIAKNLGLNLPHFYLIKFLNELEAFVVDNFMDHYLPGNLIHIYHFLDPNQPFSCQAILKVLDEKLKRITAIEQFINLCLFDALIGNHDRHGRNIAFIETKKGLELAPFYDNPSYLGIEDFRLLGANHNPRGRIVTAKTDNPTMQDYVVEFKELGYLEHLNVFNKKLQKLDLNKLIENSFLSNKRKEAFTRLTKARLQELNNAL